MSLPDIIICGKMATGKTTVAKYLESKYGYKRVAFADELKRLVDEIFYPHYLEEKVSEDCKTKPRTLLQEFGDSIRNICYNNFKDKDIWIKLLISNIKKIKNQNEKTPIVIDDCRYINELNTFTKKYGYISIRMTTSQKIRMNRIMQRYGKLPSNAELSHVSETEIDDLRVNYIIENNSSLIELYKEIDSIVEANKDAVTIKNMEL